MPGFPTANNILQKRWNQRAYELHVKKKKAMRSGLDTKKPKSFLHLKVNLKKMQSEEERQASIDYENRILLAKLTNVLRSTGQLDNWNYDYELHSKSLNELKLNDEKEKIQEENQKLLKRLQNRSSHYDTDEWEDEYLMHNYFLELKDSATKNFQLDVRGMNQQEALFYYSEDRHKRKTRAHYDKVSTIGETSSNLAPSQAAVSEKSLNDEDRMPNMDELKISKRPVKTRRRRLPRLPVLGTERKKELEKKKKEAAAKAAHYDEKDEAVKLFKATKGMGKPEVVVTNTLAKRKFSQRQQTKVKFEEQFGLNLEEELSSQLDDDFQTLTSALLTSRQDYDAMSIHSALKGQGPFTETLVEVLCTRNNGALGAIRSAYATKYSKELEEDIKAEVKGQLRHLLLAIVKGTRSESTNIDKEAADKDTEQLIATQEEDRWNADSGKMAELLQTASWSHIVTVLHNYEQITGKSSLEEIERLLVADYRDAMVSLVKCLSDCPQFLAEQIQINLQASGDEETVMRIIIMRSEVDMVLIRKAFKRLFGETLMDGIDKRLRMTCKKALVQMVVVHGNPDKPPAELPKENQQDLNQKTKGQLPPYPKPLKRPPPDMDVAMPADNPLAKAVVKSPRVERKADVKKMEKENKSLAADVNEKQDQT
ncbi:putative myosin-9-like [Apostichopus japonicus]|uniref:Putative myosin-9-like n=1 Tax=Stichopus japonicus TaxID=307972 RepID=A0A2G8KLM4_STIJA|nr:putative myosin-9-like [Apostichopus japonicus]